MTIERVLHARGPKMDFYDTDYLAGEGSNPFTVMSDGVLFGYGTSSVVGTGTVYLVVNLTKYHKDHPGWVLQETLDDSECTNYLVSNPLVPSPNVIVEGGTDYDSFYMDYWLGKYNGHTPRFVCPHKNKWCKPINFDCVLTSDVTFKKDKEYYTLKSDGTYGLAKVTVGAEVPSNIYYEKQTEDLVFDYKKFVVRDKYVLPFVNGFACFPQISGGLLHATNGASYCKDMTQRDRMTVLVDFEPVGGCAFYQMKNLVGSLKEFVLPVDIDVAKQSLLVVVDGRLILPGEYELVGKNVIIDPTIFNCIPELDRLVCSGVVLSEGESYMRTYNNTIIADGTRDLYNSDNSFVVVIEKPNLQVFKHKMWRGTSERHLSQGSSSYAALHRNVFNKNARGLLFDMETRSVYDYAREDQDATFYAEDEHREITWGSSLATVNPEDPIVLLAGTYSNNFMSAKAMLFDRARNFKHDDHIIWPSYVILDFIFRG